MKRLLFAALLIIGLLSCGMLFGQETGISGRVIDPTNAVLVDAKVSVAAVDGAKVATLTNGQGLYQFPSLRATQYVLRFEAPGFAPVEKTLTLLVGQVATVDVALQPASTSSTVNVIEDAAVVDTLSSAVSGSVNPSQVSNLPLNGRNWLELSMMVPGITKNDVNFSPLGTTGSGKLQLNVDGQQMTQNAAADSFGQPQFSRDAIDQFQIITNRFDATLGRSMQVQVNAQTKAGTNQYHGSGYGYFRNDVFNASDPVAHKVLPFSDQQYGGTVGGPIKRDKLWFFFGYEGEHQPGTIFTTPIGFGGQTFTFPTQLRTNSYILRADWAISGNHRLSVRGTGFTWSNPFANITGTAHPSRAAAQTRTSYSVVGTWTWIHSASMVNEVKAGFNHFDWDNEALVASQEYRFPTITIGGPYNYPQHFIQNSEQFRDDLYYLKGKHSFKTGAEYLRTAYTGIFQQNLRGTVLSFSSDPSSYPSVFPKWNDPSTWNLAAISPLAVSYVQGFGNFNIDVPTNALGAWVEDDWKVTPRLTLNLGVRYDNDIGIFDPSLNLKSGIVTPRKGDNLLFAPRIGFTYDVTGSRKTVIRGGAGMFYGDILANQVIDQQIFNGQDSLQPSVGAKPGQPINLQQPFGNVTGQDFLSGAAPVSTQAVQIMAHNVHTPMSLQMSIGLEREIGRNWTMTADYVHWRVYNDWIRDDANLFFDPVTGYNKNPSTAGRPNPNFTTIATFYTPNAAGSLFDALQIGVQRRFSNTVAAGVAYTYSRLKDSTTGAFYYPNNPFNFADEWANSPDDQRHTLATNASYLWKWGIRMSGSLHFGSGQAFATLAGANPFGGTVNNRLYSVSTRVYNEPVNNAPSTVPGYMITKRDGLYGNNIYRIDMRFSKTFTLKEHFRFIPIVEAFNLFNHANFGAYNATVSSPLYGSPAQNSNLAYAGRMLQFAGRFEF
jgi:hypothetical protein